MMTDADQIAAMGMPCHLRCGLAFQQSVVSQTLCVVQPPRGLASTRVKALLKEWHIF